MITEQNVRDAIAAVVVGVEVAGIPVDESFSDAGIDSLDHANILLELQEKHGLVIPDEALEECSSIRGILAFAARNAG